MLTYSAEINTATKLLSELGCLPLAIKHAGSHMAVRNRSLKKFLNIYTRNGIILYTDHQSNPLWSDRKNVIALTTWEVSFAAVKQDFPIAAELLQLFGFLAREDIWEELLRLGYHNLPQQGEFPI